VRAVTFIPDDRTVVSGGEDDTVRLWDLDTKNPIRTFTGHAKPVCALAVSRDGTIILSGDETGTIRKWDLSRPAWHRRMEKAVEAACALLDANPNDGGALKTLGEWYAQRGREAWAIDCLTSARLAGAQVSPELMARCYWRLGQRAQAAAEFQKAMAVKDAPVAYFKLCQSAAKP
jgi:tetratricopeptide (TPR) repeat protein